MLQDVLKAQAILILLVKREFRSRYAGSNIGVFWNLLHPIVMIAIYIAVFSKIMGSRMPGGAGGEYGFTIHLTSGMIPWIFFSEIVTRSCNVLVENGGMMKKMALPEEVLFLSVFATSFIVHGISMVALIAILLMLGVPLGPTVLLAFPAMLALGIAGLGLGMILSVMNLLVRDVGQFVQIALNLAFWSLPIVYPASILPVRLQQWITLNPFYGYFTMIQRIFGSPAVVFHNDFYWIFIYLPFACMLLGITFLRKNKSEILDAL